MDGRVGMYDGYIYVTDLIKNYQGPYYTMDGLSL